MSIILPTTKLVEEILSEAQRLDEEKLWQALEAPKLYVGLDHWQLWLLLCLSRHVARQEWVGSIVESRLRGELGKIGAMGAFGHPEDIGQRGMVPDLPEWSYFFHGRGCCLKHVDGAEIDVDFTEDGQSSKIDPYFYSNFLTSLRKPEFPEQILRRAHCLRNYWHEDLAVLEAHGWWEDRQVAALGLRIAKVLSPIVEHLNKLVGQSGDTVLLQSLYLLLHLGDHVQASDVAQAGNFSNLLVTELDTRASAAKAERAEVLLRALSQPAGQSSVSLEALAELGPELAKDAVIKFLFRTPVEGTANRALEIWDFWQLEDFDSVLEDLVEFRTRLSQDLIVGQDHRGENHPEATSDETPNDSQLVHLARILCLRHGESLKAKIKALLVKSLQGIKSAKGGEAALLLYFLDARQGLEALRKALVDWIPMTRYEAAAACVLINSEETKQLLIATLECDQVEKQHAAACALNRIPGGLEIPELKNWMSAQDGISEPLGKESQFGDKIVQTYSMNDVTHANMQSTIDWAIRGLRNLTQLFPAGPIDGS